jgi:murein DD-endopeptidase MepM/ murein hydrolase activator NlpD
MDGFKTSHPWTKPTTRVVVPLLLVVGICALIATTRERDRPTAVPLPLLPTPPYDGALGGQGERPLPFADVDVPEPFTVRRRQTLAAVLDEMGVGRREAHDVGLALGEHVDVRRIRAGEQGDATFDDSGQLARLRLELAGKGRVELVRGDEGWTGTWQAAVRRVEVRRVRASLDSFLESAIREAGGDPRVAYKMSNVLQWDLDFNRDLRKGDRFEVLYEDVTLDGARTGPDAVLAMTYDNRGRRYEAYRYGDGGYYDAAGKPLQKMFLRSPLTFSRVTSRFSHKRFHPILKVNRPHYGVDYGAPTGTPVRVTASGTIYSTGYTKGGGNTIKVRHPNGYLTAYLHLSRYAKGLYKGKSVRQEDVIGYVGSTGLATAPHLDYRVQKNGRWIDPLKLPNEPAEPIPEDELALFFAHRDELRVRLGGEGGGGGSETIAP